jgi:transposase
MRQPPTVTLTDEERATLETLVHRGKANARTVTRARILLKSAEGWSTAALVEALDVCSATVTNVRRRFAQGGLEGVLHDKVQQRRRSALSGLQTAHLIAVVCSPSPDGHDHWTVRLLAQKAVELGFVPSISPNTIHELLKKTNSNPGSTSIGVSLQSVASLSRRWKTCWTCTQRSTTRSIRPFA